MKDLVPHEYEMMLVTVKLQSEGKLLQSLGFLDKLRAHHRHHRVVPSGRLSWIATPVSVTSSRL